MSLKITDVRVILTAPEGINLAAVKVMTNQDGLYGVGCATFAYRVEAVKCLIEEYLKPLLVGRDPQDIEELWQLMHQNGYWRNGPIENNAISGIDMALWDIKGKLAGLPLYQLFGGRIRKGVPVYRHADGRTLDELCENIQRFQEMGIKHIRCQCGGYGGTWQSKGGADSPEGAYPGIYLDSRRYIKDTLKLFDGIRSKLGFDIELIHDVHERISPTEAMGFVKELEPYRLFFVEDVLPLDQIEWFRKIRSSSTTPLAEGELFNNPAEWRHLITEQLIDYIRVHISQIGGITPARKLAVFAEQFGVKTAWHGPGDMTPIAHAANVHIDLAAPNFGVQEWSGIEPPNVVIQDVKGPHGALLEVFPGLPEFRNGYVYGGLFLHLLPVISPHRGKALSGVCPVLP